MKRHFLRYFIYYMLFLAGGALVYYFGGRFYLRIDLTEDQRYCIHPATQKLLGELKEGVHVAIYLTGDLPTDFKQLKRATQELLEECNVYAHHQLHYEFVDLDKVSVAEKKNCLRKLAVRGIQPTNLYMQEKGQRIERFILPAALLTYKDKEEGVLLLRGNKMATPAQMINQSMEGLEYELASAIERLVCTQRKRVALLRGHGAPGLEQLNGLINALETHYVLHLIDFSAESALTAYDAVLITKPQQPFSEKEKYVLDQYIMQGGKVLFFLDKLRVNMDHLREQETFAFPLEVGLDDQLFKYGVRINADLIQDLCAGVYPVVVGNLGNQPQLKLLPWPFFPLLNHFADHLVTKNLDILYPQFVSSIDMIQIQGVTHTPLVFTSQHARKLDAPVHLALEALRKPPEPAHYSQGYIPVAYLLEGIFTSLYKNRFVPEGLDVVDFFSESQPTKLLVVASGGMVLNGLDFRKKNPLPLGYDPFLQQHFANQDFVCNVLAYMLNEEGLIKLKHKSLKIRFLDRVKLVQERRWWQLVNLIVPMLLLGLLGGGWNYAYKRIYTKL